MEQRWVCDQPKVGRGEAGAAAPSSRVRSCGFATRGRLGSGSAGVVRAVLVHLAGGNTDRARKSEVPWAHSGSPCLRAAVPGRLGGGFQLQTQSVGELGLLPVKLKIAHMEGRTRSAGCVLAERFLPAVPPAAPTSPHRGQVLGKRFFFWLLRESLFWPKRTDVELELSPFTFSRFLCLPRGLSSAGIPAVITRSSSRQELSFIRNTHTAPAPPAQPWAQDGATSTHK